MKIAYILPSLKNTGPVIVAKFLVDVLVKKCSIDVFYFDELTAMNFMCPTYRITMNTMIPFDNYDIIHSHCFRPDKYVIKWHKNIKKAKIITTLHQDTYRSFRFQYNIILSYLFTKYWCVLQSKFDGVISISEQLRLSYMTRIKAPITTIYNGSTIRTDGNIDCNLLNRLLSLRDKYKILGTYAFVTPRKGLAQILKALVCLPTYAFVIIGEGPDIKRLKLLSNKLGLSNRVIFFPYQKNPCNYLPYFDIYVMPSYSEGFGLSIVEAALAHKAIVCSDISSFHEIFPHNEVRFFELNNIPSLCDAIASVYIDKIHYETSAYERAYGSYTIQVMAQNHLDYYKQIVL